MTQATKIINRTSPCCCGCQGQDSRHAKSFNRVVRDVVVLDDLGDAQTKAFGPCKVLARGRISHPDGEDGTIEVDFVVHEVEGWGWRSLGWCTRRAW
jgi:hypothetical protein